MAERAPRASQEQRPEANRWVVTFSIVLGTLMGAIDMSIVNVALPDIRASYGATLTEISWVATGYLVAVVVVLPLTSWFSQVIGRRNVYLVAVVIFTASSLGSGLSTSLSMLVFFRILQGLGAGLMQPIAMAVLRETFPPVEQAMAMGVFGFAILLGPAIGPTLGGWLTDRYGWPWIFYINLPIGALTLFMVFTFVSDPPYLERSRVSEIDALGVAALVVGLGGLQIVLSEGQSKDWFGSLFITVTTIIAGLGLAFLVLWELRTKRPAVDLTVLKNGAFAAGSTLGAILGFALFGSLFLLPLFLQELLGYTAFQSGIALLPRSGVMLIGMPIAGRLYNYLGPRIMLGVGLLLAAYGSWEMGAFTLDTSYLGFAIPQIWQGAAFSLIFVSLSTASLLEIPRRRMTNATALYNLIRQIGASFGIAIVATLLEKHIQFQTALLSERLSPYNPNFVSLYGAVQSGLVAKGVAIAEAPAKALAMLQLLVGQQASVLAYEYVFKLVAIILAATFPLIFLLHSPKEPLSREHVD